MGWADGDLLNRTVSDFSWLARQEIDFQGHIGQINKLYCSKDNEAIMKGSQQLMYIKCKPYLW